MNIAFNQANPQNPDLNPLDAELARDPDASAVWSKCRAGFGTMQRAFDQLSTISDQLFAQLAQIEANTRLTPDAKAQDKAERRNQAQESIEALRRSCEAARQQVLTTTQTVLDGNISTKPNPMATLVDIEHTRDAWGRIQMILDSHKDSIQALSHTMELAKSAAEGNDNYAQAAIRQNIGAYLESRGITIPSNVLMPQINHAMIVHVTPAMRAATQIRTVLDQGWASLQAAFLIALGHAKGSNTMRVHGLAGWPGYPEINL